MTENKETPKKQKRLKLNSKKFKKAQQICNDSTPGPWKRGDKVGGHISEVIAPCPCCGRIAVCDQFGPSEDKDNYNSDFIAKSRTLLPRALREIELLNDEIKRVNKILEATKEELFTKQGSGINVTKTL